MILHCGSKKGWLPNGIHLSEAALKVARADYHENMDAATFEK